MAIGDGVSAIASLAVTFGGFSPTAMDGVEATRDQVKRVEAAQALKRAADERKREIERARTSKPRRFTDDSGSAWTYVVLDDAFARIESCKRPVTHVKVPEEVDGYPVRAIGSDVFCESDLVESITCPDGVDVVGACAFRSLPNLKSVIFPSSLSAYSGSWLAHCDSLEEMVLPGLLDEIKPAVFDNAGLKRLVIGEGTRSIDPGAFRKSVLERLEIHPKNPYIVSDGTAIYSVDGAVLLAFARPVAKYAVRPGCRKVAKKAFDGSFGLEQVILPEGVEVIGRFAFTHSGIRSFKAPATLRTLEEKAFYYCRELSSVELNDGLSNIGDSAFEESGIRALSIPASIESIGSSVTRGTFVRYRGSERSISIAEGPCALFIDECGGLYRREEDGVHFIQLMDAEAISYDVVEGTAFVDERAFAFHEAIEDVSLPEGVREIRKSAFRVCGNLRRVSFPESLESIGKEAFFDTSLEALRLPAGFRELGEDALVTVGAHRLGSPPSLRSIEVSSANPRFYVESGLLCKRGRGGDRGIVFNDDVADVVIPDNVTAIAAYAFNNARNIETISIGPNLRTIGTAGLSTWCYIREIHVELDEPVEGRRTFDICFPDTDRAVHEIANGLGGSSWVNVPDMLRHYDNCLANAHNYHAPADGDITAHEQARLMLGRLKDPIALAAVNRSIFERTIREHLVDMCVDAARHDDRAVVDDFCDFGFLNRDNLEDVIVAVGRLQDAAMTGYLLELKRERFGRAALDFDL